MSTTTQSARGFTLVELLVVIPTTLLVVAVIVGFMVDLYGQLLRKDGQVNMALEAQNALNSIQDDLFFARNFAEKASTAMVDANGPSGSAAGWEYNTTPATLIVYQIALDKSYQASDRQVVYQRTDLSGNSCDPADIELNPPVLNNLIYYVDGNSNLKRRVLVPDPIHPRCSEPFLKQSCPTESTRTQQNADGTTSSVACPADITLASGVSAFTIDYYDADGNLLNMATGASPLQAERITMKLTLTKTVAAQPISYSTQLSVKKVNRGDPTIQ